MANPIIEVQKKLVPDLVEVMSKRHQVLQSVRLLQPIGRRGLSTYLTISERVLRSEVMFLRDQGLLEFTSNGMGLTISGEETLEKIDHLMKDLQGIKELEENVKAALNIEDIHIVAGNCDENSLVKKEIGRMCANLIKEYLADDASIIAVTGGTTVSAVSEMMTPLPKEKQALFVPARGGLGKDMEYQANAICARMAEKSNGDYRLLHVPDQVSDIAYKSIIAEQSVSEVLELIQSSHIVIHGIGNALEMASRRNTSEDIIEKLIERKAQSEAFGYYFNEEGKVVQKINTIGLQLENIKNSKHVLAVAGGSSKAKAIIAYMKSSPSTRLITDEGAVKSILEIIS